MVKVRLVAVAALVLASKLALAQASDVSQSGKFRAELVANVPKLALLRQYAPATFEKVARVYEDGMKSGRSQDESIGEARTIFAQDQLSRMRRAPDALVLAAEDNAIATGGDLLLRSPERCVALFTGGDAGDIKAYLSAATVRQADEQYISLLRLPSGPDLDMATPEELRAAMIATLPVAARSLGLAPQDFSRAATGSAGAEQGCRAQLAFLRTLRTRSDAVRVLRRQLGGAAP